MDRKLIVIVALVMAVAVLSVVDARPTCPEPTCGGTRTPLPGELASPPGEGEGEGEEGEEEEEEDPNCSKNPFSAWLNNYAWYVFCKDGTIGATENPIGKIGKPAEEPEDP